MIKKLKALISRKNVLWYSFIFSVLLCFSCAEDNPINHLQVPNGFNLVCAHEGVYTWQDEDGYIAKITPYKTKQKAINAAWSWKEYKETPHEKPPQYEWVECD